MLAGNYKTRFGVGGASFPLEVDLGIDFSVAEGASPTLFYTSNVSSSYELFLGVWRRHSKQLQYV